MLIAAVAPLLLAGCLWTPGKFNSELVLRKGGAFVLDYRGEIVLQTPSEMDQSPKPWSPVMARCHTDGQNFVKSTARVSSGDDPVDPKTRHCTAAELAKLKSDYEKQVADQLENKRKEADKMAKMFGLPGADEESNRRFAATLLKYKGWRSAVYRGKGVFDVDYHFEGRADQDFAFPLMPDSNLVHAVRRNPPAERRNGAGYRARTTGGSGGPFGARAMALGMPDTEKGPASRAEGRFTGDHRRRDHDQQ